jgi:mRNA interferase HigB
MKVRLIKKQSIEKYIKKNAQGRSSFTIWISILKCVDWNEPSDIITTFNKADILGKGTERVVFNIGGNNYRMICRYHFGRNKVHLFIKWIGTHAEYTKLCNEKYQYSVNQF